jgi:hypothetical protein
MLALLFLLADGLRPLVLDADGAIPHASDVCRTLLVLLASWPVARTTLHALLLVTPLTFFHLIFTPCFECFDFEAAAAHEMGHVLGFVEPSPRT